MIRYRERTERELLQVDVPVGHEIDPNTYFSVTVDLKSLFANSPVIRHLLGRSRVKDKRSADRLRHHRRTQVLE